MRIASYASGHGLGHATRVCALAECLRTAGHEVFCCSNAPEMAFEGAVAKGARYRKVAVDAGVVQPTAYEVARSETLHNLEAFLARREAMIDGEVEWLRRQRIDLVLVDAPFIPCAAAAQAGIRSLIVSNFTFDSCYSYLAVRANSLGSLDPSSALSEPALDPERLRPIVDRTVRDYSCASLVLRLPGAVPMPPFDTSIPLPATSWVDLRHKCFTEETVYHLEHHPDSIIDMPLLVRSTAPDVYSPGFRSAILTKLGVPPHLHDPATTRILLVSFGGQVIPRPPSRQPSPQPNGRPHRNGTSLSSSTSSSSSVSSSRVLDGNDLLPAGWIAVVCGTAAFDEDAGFRDDMPRRFFPCVSGIHIPDLTAICDVVLGKLGYGTCSETLATSTPFVYVPRPLFVEEYGLKRLMQSKGTAVEMDRRSFEDGLWSDKILEAWERGRDAKQAARKGRIVSMSQGAGEMIVERIEAFMNGVNG